MAEAFLSSSWYRIAELKPKLRPHAQIHRHRYRNQAWYVLQDHATGRIHRFTPAAYVFIGNMDGQRSIDQLWTEIAIQLDENAPTQDEIIRLLSQLHAADMLQLDTRPDSVELFDRFSKQRRSVLKRNLKNPLSMTFPLWDPDDFLERSLKLIRPLMSTAGLVTWVAIVLPALVLAMLYWSDLTHNMSDRILSADGLLLIALIYPVVKLIHEFAHAYTTKRFGGEVHEMGVMFLVFYPVPYVDASNSSAFPSKWQRAAVGASGMIAELFVAAIALYIWLAIEPGIVRACAYDTILIAGISTLIVNGNPLLRFDGYYILSDLLEIPNLAQRSARYWAQLTERYVFWAETTDPEAAIGERKWLAFYAPASFCYRLIVVVGIAIFVATEYFIIGVLIACWALFSASVLPFAKGIRHALSSPGLRQTRARAVGITLATPLIALIFLLVIPFPLHTTSEGVIWLPDSARIRAGTDGFVKKIVARPGDTVGTGDVLFESEEPFLQMKVEVDRHKVRELELKMSAQQFVDRVQAELARDELEQEKGNLARDLKRDVRLVARSSSAGKFEVSQAEDFPDRYFHEGDILGYVTPPNADTVRAIVSQDDIGLVRNHLTSIEVRIPGRMDERYSAVVIREVPGANDELPSKALGTSGGGSAASDPRDSKGSKSLRRFFQFDLRLRHELPKNTFGSRAYVRFSHDWEPLGHQLYRRIRQLFLARFYV